MTRQPHVDRPDPACSEQHPAERTKQRERGAVPAGWLALGARDARRRRTSDARVGGRRRQGGDATGFARPRCAAYAVEETEATVPPILSVGGA